MMKLQADTSDSLRLSWRSSAGIYDPQPSIACGAWQSRDWFRSGQWQHVAVQWDRQAVRYFLNGVWSTTAANGRCRSSNAVVDQAGVPALGVRLVRADRRGASVPRPALRPSPKACRPMCGFRWVPAWKDSASCTRRPLRATVKRSDCIKSNTRTKPCKTFRWWQTRTSETGSLRHPASPHGSTASAPLASRSAHVGLSGDNALRKRYHWHTIELSHREYREEWNARFLRRGFLRRHRPFFFVCLVRLARWTAARGGRPYRARTCSSDVPPSR